MPYFDSHGSNIHYEVSGPDWAPVVILIHSLGANLRMWDALSVHLVNDFRLLGYDLSGHGESSISPAPNAIGQFAADLISLLDHLEIGPASFCGISIGGLIAIQVTLIAPQRVSKLVLANTAARIGSVEGWQQRIIQVDREGLNALAESTPDRWFTEAYRTGHPEEMRKVRGMVAATQTKGYLGCCAVLRDTDLRAQIGGITKPTLVITGAYDAATPPEEGRSIHTAIQGSQLIELKTSHISAWEQPEAFGQAVANFLHPKENYHG